MEPEPPLPPDPTARPAAIPPTLRQQQQQPIKDAVNTAFDQTPTPAQLDPDLMKRLTEQVTEQVLKSLQAANLGGTTPTPTPIQSAQPVPSRFAPPPREPQRQSTQDSVESWSGRHTPPSPLKERDRDRRADSRRASPSPDRAPSDAGSTFSRDSRRSRASTLSSRETPRASQTDSLNEPRWGTSSANRSQDSSSDAGRRPRKVSNDDTTEPKTRSSRRESQSSDHSNAASASRSRARPSPPMPSEVEETTTLEKIWQPLFDNGNPTMRLSQFLRGLAKHLIDDYEPKGSLVVTPAKMVRFFDETKLADEYYPWSTIFGGKITNASLSKMYQKLLCQHHLVQHQHHEMPTIPGLTPAGFDKLMTCLIQAHPDAEFERLRKAVMDMPISNADDKSERFPKDLSRRLIPALPNVQAEQRLIASLNHEPLVQLARGATAMPPPPPQSAPAQTTSFLERERYPYSSANAQRSNVFDDQDLAPPPSMPIERERKPYYGKEGGGKKYDNGDAERDRDRDRDREPPSRPPTSQYRPDPSSGARSGRTNSGLPPQATYPNPNSNNSSSSSDPVSIPGPNRNGPGSHRPSQPPPPPMGPGANYPPNINAKPRRSSPAPSYPVGRERERERSERYGSEGGDEDGRATGYSRRQQGEEERERGWDIPPRGGRDQQQDAYEAERYGYGAAGPGGSFNSRVGGGGGNGYEERRRSGWYPNGNPGNSGNGNGGGGGGSDGYGSFSQQPPQPPSTAYGSQH